MEIEIRKATAEDACVIARLNEAFNDILIDEEGIAKRVVQNAPYETLFLAEIEDTPVGFLCLRVLSQICDEAPYAEVSELYVEEEFRRKGVAQALIASAIATATEADARELLVSTNFRNHSAQQFYFATGFGNYCLTLHRKLSFR